MHFDEIETRELLRKTLREIVALDKLLETSEVRVRVTNLAGSLKVQAETLLFRIYGE